MIKLSKMTDYAVVVMARMARDGACVQTVPQLAERTGVPAPTVAKLMKLLAPAGLMESHRGATGGYSLTRAAEEHFDRRDHQRGGRADSAYRLRRWRGRALRCGKPVPHAGQLGQGQPRRPPGLGRSDFGGYEHGAGVSTADGDRAGRFD